MLEDYARQWVRRRTANRDGEFYRDPSEAKLVVQDFRDAVRMAEVGDTTTEQDPGLRLFTPPAQAIQEALLDAISPDVESVRTEVEGRTQGAVSLPFESYADALAWIDQVKEEGFPEVPPDRQTLSEQWRHAVGILREVAESLDRRFVRPRREKLILPVVRPGENDVEYEHVSTFSPLAPVAHAARELSEKGGRTPFRDYQMVAHILAGQPPILPRYHLAFSSRRESGDDGEIGFKVAHLRLYDPSISQEEFQDLHREVRQGFGVYRRKKVLTKRDVRVLGVVAECGDPEKLERGEKGEYWRQVCEELQARGVEGLNSGRAAQDAWERARKRRARLVLA